MRTTVRLAAVVVAFLISTSAYAAVVDLSITSTGVSPSTITLGTGNIQYNVNLFNNSATAATNAVLTANLPASSTFVSANATGGGLCNESGGVVTCNWATYPSGSSFSATITVTPGAPGANTLTSSIASADTDPVPGNNNGSGTITVNDQIDLAVFSTSASPGAVTLGTGNITYTLNLYNWSSSKATNAQLSITLPASSTFVSATPTGAGGSCSGTGPVTCNWADYPSGASYSVTVVVTPGAPGTNTLSASISATQPDPDNVTASHLNSGSASSTVNDQIDLAVFSTSASPGAVTLGTGNITYTINLYNWSSSKATNAQLSITLPASSTFVSATPTGAGGSCSGTGPVTCNWADYPSGASYSVTVIVTPGAPGTNTLSASISATQPDPDNVTASHLNSGSASSTVNDQIDLAVFSASASPGAVTLGTGNITYTLNLYNWSSSKATNAQLSITLPASSTFVSATPTGAGGSCGGTGPVTCNWADYPSGASYSVTVVVTPGAPGTNTLSASISATQPDPDNATAGHLNSGSASSTVNDQIDLAVFSTSASPGAVTLGTGNITYTLNLYNWSSSKATNAQLSITLPASSTFVSATPTGAGGSCGGTGPVTCNWADYPSGASYSVTVVVTPGAPGTNTLSASISATQPDPDNVTASHLNSGSASSTVNDQIDLAIFSISDSPDPRTLGAGDVTYTLNLYNWSSSKATNAQLTITLPASSGFVSATPTGAGGSCSGTGPVTCTWADYPSGASYSVTVVVTPGVAGINTLNASLTATQNDPDEVTASHLRTDTETTLINPSSAPTITGFTPGSGSANTPVTISGANFTGTTSVKFTSNVSAAFTVVNDSTLTTNVPAGAITGVISVTNAIGTTSSASSFTVNAGITVINTNDTGTGSLRDAIAQANSGACPSACTISFSIGSGAQTITPLSPLPNIAAANVTIDGTTQPGYSGTPLIGLNGASAGASARGLVLAGGNGIVKGLRINGFTGAYPFGYGIYITSANNTVKGNYIGTNATGNAASPNRAGIVIETAAATGNTIGGLTAADRNLISGNTTSGVSIENGPASNTVVGNYIGTDVTGNNDVGNGFNGVNLESANNNIIGGTSAAARNIISFNDSPNVNIWVGASGNSVHGNYIGTNAAGTAASGNGSSGVNIEGGASGNFIGGISAGAGNLISGNAADGVRIADTGTNGNFVQGNTIGLNVSGTGALANAFIGVSINNGAQGNTIGGTSASTRNLISGNGRQGIGINGTNTNNNVVQGNYIGTNPAGSAAMGNTWAGIGIWGGAQNNTIGGNTASARNIISGNLEDGVAIRDTNTSSNTVAGNYIGTDVNGTFAVANGWYGVDIFAAATNNTVGGNTPTAMNLLSGNTLGGVLIADAGTSGNVLGSNQIGTNAAASGPIANGGAGVKIHNSAGGNDVGSSSSPNKIAFNNKGIALTSSAGIGNRFSANAMSQNTGIGIDLNNDGITPNDGTDGDTGPNNLQNFPVLNSATISAGTSLDFKVTIDSSGSSPSLGLKFELFKADTSSPEQGLTYLGTTTCVGPTFSNAAFNMTVAGITAGNKIVATATSYTDNTCTVIKDGTSEFSAAVLVTQGMAALNISKAAPANVAASQTFNYVLTVTNGGPYPAENVSVFDTLPAGLIWSSTTAPGWSCSAAPNITCTRSSHPVGSSTITFNVTAPASATTLNNTATITATNDSTSGDDSSLATTNVTTASADLGLTKSPNVGTVAVGGSVTYTVTVQNFGPSPASSVVMTDALPPGQTATTANSTQGPCTTGTTVTCTIGAMPNGATVTITIVATANTGGTWVNTATKSATEGDANGANDTASATVTVTGSNTLTVLNANDSGNGSLRQAIADANSGVCTAPCTINFAISPLLPIAIATPLPNLNVTTTLNGMTQPGFTNTPLVHLDGSTCIGCNDGFTFNAGQSLMKAIEVSGFPDAGIVVGNTATGVRLLEIKTDANGGIGIDLGNNGPTANDTGDSDNGANNLQNTPVINSAILGGGNLFLNFSVDSTSVLATNSLRVDFYKGDGAGEGMEWLGYGCYLGVRTLTNQTQTMSAGSISAGTPLVATATSYSDSSCGTPSDGTSEFSPHINAANCTPPPATVTAPPFACPSSGGHGASVTATAGATYAWSITNGTITAGAGTSAVTFTAGASGTTTLNVTVTLNGCNNSGSANVPIKPTPTSTTGGSTSICAGGSATISATLTGTPPFNLTWSDGFNQTVSSGTTASRSVSPGTTTGYSVTAISDAFCTGTASGTTTVLVNPLPTATVSGSTAICAGTSANISATLTGTVPFNITWSDGFNQTIGSGTLATRSVSPGTTTTYTITSITDANCSGTSSGSAIITVNPPPTVNITGPAATCAGTPVTLDAGPFSTYFWSTGQNTQTISVSPTVTTTYTVTVTDTNGCTGTDSHTVVVSNSPIATINAPAAACASSTNNTASVPAGAASYVWTITNGTITAGQNTSAITFSANASGTINLGVTITNGACTSNGSANVPIAAPPVVNITGPTTACPNESFILDAGVFSTYQWNTGATTRFLNITQSSPSVTYSVIVTDGNGCSGSDTHTVTLNPGVNATISAPSNVDPGSTNHNASVPAQPGATFNWTITNGTITAGNGTNSITFNAGGTGTLDLNVTVTLNTCTANGSATVTVGTPAQADFSVTKSAPASVQAGASLTWTIVVTNNGPNGASGQLSDGLPGNVTVTSIDDGPWTCGLAAETVNCNGFLDSGASNTILITATAPQQAGTITNTVVVTSPLGDPNPGNNAASVSTSVVAGGGTCQITPPPTLLAPVNATVTDANVTFQWTGVAGAIGYDVYLAALNGTPVLIGSTNETSFTYSVPPGDLSWFVVANFNGCPPSTSATATFNYTPPAACEDNQRPLLISPLDDSVATAPVDLDWNDPTGATRYVVYVVRGNSAPVMVGTTTASELHDVNLGPGNVRWFVRAFYAQSCSPLDSDEHQLRIVPLPAACADLDPPVIAAPGEISSGVEFLLQWGESPGATGYQLQLASNANFDNAELIATGATSHALARNNNGNAPLAVYARVRAVDARCTPVANVSAYGPATAIFILPQQQPTLGSVPLSDPTPVHYTINLGPEFAGQSFIAESTEEWLTVSPSSGVVAAGGTNLNVTANTADLGVGTHSGAIKVTFDAAASRLTAHGSTVSTTINVNLVTPVTPAPANTPTPDTMIIPAVANADGINSHFQSDVRVANTSAKPIKYQLNFIPSGDAGSSAGRQTTFSIEPGRTIALDDILKSWFGTGTSNASGVLQIKPLTTTSSSVSSTAFGPLANLVSFASSRTFNVTPIGTYGQYVPAVPFANFADKSTVLSLQQIAQSAKMRSNLGLVEGSGNPADLLIKVFGGNGQQLTSFTTHLNAGQHTQLNAFLFERGIQVDDGRVEIQVTSSTGKVTAYASVLDNETSDGVLVTPVALGSQGNTKWVLPGVADIRSGFADWQSDVRVFNAGTSPANVTASFYSQGGGDAKVQTITLGAGEVKQLDKVLPTLFGVTNDGGALHLSTADTSRIIATARTYNQTTKGTYGQFINAVTPQQAVAVGTRPLQLLQIEESSRMRSNIGVVEVTGKPVKLEVTVTPPDAKFAAVIEVDLAANEYRQMNSLLAGLGLGDTYNARVSVRAVSGQGRATAFASVIDLATNDPLYVEAQ